MAKGTAVRKAASGVRTLLVVLNGKSAGEPRVREAVESCRQAGHQVDVRVTWENGQAGDFAEEAARAGCDIIVAAGGDGTVSEVAGGILRAGESCPSVMGIVPLGTANDFATACQVPTDPGEALLLAATAEGRPIDIGSVNGRTFINVASAGFGAEVTAETPEGIKRVLGGAAYGLMGLVKAFTMTPHTGTIVTPDGTYKGQMMLMAIGNSRLAGGGFQVAPRAVLDDGLLDLVVVPDVAFPETGSLVSELVRMGTEEPQRVLYRQLPAFELQSDTEVHMNLDGEPMQEKSFRVEVLPRRLKLALPEGAPLAGSEAAAPEGA